MDMINLKTYRMFESVTELTREQVQWLDDCTKGRWELNTKTGLVDVTGDFSCSGQGLSDFKGVKFGMVDGSFYCADNDLTSLVGAPQMVDDSFYCSYNALTSLVGAPQEVGEGFHCEDNQLTTLEGAPQKVGADFYCSYNALTSLEGAPLKVGYYFYCRNNRLTSLVGAPQKVGCDFHCDNNLLTSLEGAPLRVGEDFNCEDNPVSRDTLKTIFDKMQKNPFDKMQKNTSYLAAVESIWSEIPQDDQVLLYGDDFKWVTPEQGRGLVALRAYHDLRGML